MKDILNIGVLVLLISTLGLSQESWDQKADFPGDFWWQSVSFSIGSKGYVGTGTSNPSNIHDDFWEYDTEHNTWTKLESLPMNLQESVGFSIGSKGYIGTGEYVNGDSLTNRFFEYDVDQNIWTELASFPGVARDHAFGFSVNNKGYIGGGSGGNDLWEYDPETQQWNEKSNMPISKIRGAASFTIGDLAYIGVGVDSSGYSNIFFEYDAIEDTWTRRSDFGGEGRWEAVSFSLGEYGYIGTGLNPQDQKDFWRYDPSLDQWTQIEDFPGEARYDAIAFSVDNKGYVGLGANEKDMFELCDLIVNTNELSKGILDTKIFPNPGIDKIEISFSEMVRDTKVSIHSYLGNNLMTMKSFNGKDLIIDISEFSKGTYIINITNQYSNTNRLFQKL